MNAATPATAASTHARASSGRRRVGIERKILRKGDGRCIPGRRGDHRRVVGAERERRERRIRKGRAKLRVRGDAADDRDPGEPCSLRRLGRALDEGAHDRALIARGEVGAARSSSSGAQVPHRVEQCGLQRRRRRSPGPRRGRRGSGTPPGRPRGRAGRSRLRRGSRARGAARPCRRPHPPRRRASSRGPSKPSRSRTSRSSVWPPLASRQRNGGSSSWGWR